MTKKLLLALTLVLFMQSGSFAVEDVWGGMGLSEDSVNYDYANTVFDKYTAPNNQKKFQIILKVITRQICLLNLHKLQLIKKRKIISDIEFYGLNSITQEEIMEKMQMKQGEYSRDLMQTDLKLSMNSDILQNE